MTSTIWQSQPQDQPLFPDLLWSRPERADVAGKLLIVGGSTHSFVSVVKALEKTKAAGIGEAKAVLPSGVQKYLGTSTELLYAAQTATGSFSAAAVDELRDYLGWAQGLLLPGDLTKNAETTIFAENLVHQSRVPCIATGEALDLLIPTLGRHSETPLVVVADFRQLQTLVRSNPITEALLPRTTLEQRVKILQQLLQKLPSHVFVLHDQKQFLVVSEDQASLTNSTMSTLDFAAKAAVLCVQFPSKLFEAVTTAAIV